MSYINRFTTILRQHWLAVILGCSIGLLMAAPYVWFQFTPQYRGVVLLGQDAEEHYVARIQEAYDGNPLMTNVFLPYKHVPYLMPGLGEDLVAWAGMAAHVSAVNANLVSKFVFPLLAFLFAYGLAYAVSESQLAALSGAALALLGTALMSDPREMLSLLHGKSSFDGVYWARPINPEVSGALLFASLWLMLEAPFERPRAWAMIISGVLIGASLYVSVFIWLFFGGLLVALVVYFLWKKQLRTALSWFISGAIALACAVPFFINFLHAKTFPGYANAAMQQGMLTSHAPALGIWVVLLLVSYFIWPNAYLRSRSFFMAAFLALTLALNQQVVTGVYLQPGHFHWYITKPLAGLIIGMFGIYYVRAHVTQKWAAPVASFALIVFLLLDSAAAQAHFYQLHTPAAITAQTYAPVLTYLEKATPGETVWADPTLSNYIAMYTSDNAPDSLFAGLYISPVHYFEKRLFLEYRLRGISATEALSVMQQERSNISQQLYGIYWAEKAGSFAAIPDSTLQSLAQQYAAYNSTHSVVQMLQELGITVIVEDTAQDNWSATELASLQKTTTIANRFALFRAP